MLKSHNPLARCLLIGLLGWVFFEQTPCQSEAEAGTAEDAVLLREETEIEILSESEARVRYLNHTKVLTRDGVGWYEVAEIPYNRWIDIRKVEAATLSPDGKRIKVKKKSFSDSSSYASYALYSDSMSRNIHFPAVVPGSVLEYSYEVTLRSLFFLDDVFLLQRSIPMQSMTVTIMVPSSLPLRISVEGSDPEYRRTESGGKVIHRWRVADAPPLRGEHYMPPRWDLYPKISIFPKEIGFDSYRIDTEKWEGIARWYWELARDRMKSTADVSAQAKKLTEGLTDPRERTRAVFEYLRDDIIYVAISLGIGGWQPHASSDILSHQYGDCKDKATLMVAMLRSVDLEGFPALIRTRDAGLLNRDYPTTAFNHAIVAVPDQDGYLFMDPTSTTTQFGDLPWGDQGVPILVVRPGGEGELVETPLYAPAKNRRHRSVTARLLPTGQLEGKYVIDTWGQHLARMTAWVGTGETVDTEDFIEDYLAGMCPGARMEKHHVKLPSSPGDPLRLEIDFEVPRFVTRIGRRELLTPHLTRFSQLTDLSVASERRHPVFFPFLYTDTSEVRLALPPDRTLKRLPDSEKIEGPGITASTEYELVREKGQQLLLVRRSLTVSRREIPPDEFPALRDFLAALAKQDASGVTLE